MTQMLKYISVRADNLRVGDLLDLHGDVMAKHARNADTCTLDVLDRIEHEFAEVFKIDRNYESVTVLFQFGEMTFPPDYFVRVFQSG